MRFLRLTAFCWAIYAALALALTRDIGHAFMPALFQALLFTVPVCLAGLFTDNKAVMALSGVGLMAALLLIGHIYAPSSLTFSVNGESWVSNGQRTPAGYRATAFTFMGKTAIDLTSFALFLWLSRRDKPAPTE